MKAWLAVTLCACTGIDSDVGGGELLAHVDGARVVAVGGEQLYVAGKTGLYRLPRAGAAPDPLDPSDSIYQLTADANAVYWTDSDGVFAFRVGATTREKLGEMTPSITPLVADSIALYHADYYGQVWRTPKTGGGTTLFGMTDTTVGYLAVAPEGVWVTTLTGAKRLGTNPMVQTFPRGQAHGIAWYEGELYLEYAGSGDTDGSVVRAPAEVLEDGLVLPDGLVPTSEGLYFTTGNLDAAVRRVPVVGGGSELVAGGNRPTGLAVDEAFIYWTDPYPGDVRRVPR